MEKYATRKRRHAIKANQFKYIHWTEWAQRIWGNILDCDPTIKANKWKNLWVMTTLSYVYLKEKLKNW